MSHLQFALIARQQPLIPPVVWITLLAIAGVIIGVYLFFRGFPLLRRKRLLQDTPISTVRAAAIGSVEITGKAVGPYTLISPISAFDCFYYKVVAWQAVGEGRNKRWTKKAEETLYAPIFIEDDTGRLMLDPRQAELELPPDTDEECETSDVNACTSLFLARHLLSPGDAIKLAEYSIKPGDVIFVLGTLQQNDGRPGFLSSEAADLQRREMLEVLRVPVPDPRSAQVAGFDLAPLVLIGKGKPPLLISRSSPRDVVEQLASQSILYIWGGAALALGSLVTLLIAIGRW